VFGILLLALVVAEVDLQVLEEVLEIQVQEEEVLVLDMFRLE
jgi:hypothetical protein